MTSIKLSQEQVVAFAACAFLCVSVVAYWFVFTRITAQKLALTTAHTELTRIIAEDEAHDALTTFIAQTEADRSELKGYFLSRYNPTPFLALVENLGVETGVEITVESLTENTVEAAGTNASKDTQYLQVVLTAVGQWDHIYALLHLFEHMPYIVEVDGLTFAEEDEAGVWEGQVHLRVAVQ